MYAMNANNEVRINVRFIIVASLRSNLKVKVLNLIKKNNATSRTNGINK